MTQATQNKTQQIKGTCTGYTDKAVFFKSEAGNQATFPKSQVKIIDGSISKGAALVLDVPKWLLAQQQQKPRLPDHYPPKTPTLITGVVVDTRPKALAVKCDADMVTRWLALSQITLETGSVEAGEIVRIIAPAWMLKHKSGSYPSWVKGAAV